MSAREYLITGLFLAYYWTAFEMLFFHSNLSGNARPVYVKGSIFRRFIAGVFWPLVSKFNGEFGWFFTCFVSYAALLTVLLAATSSFISTFTCVLIIGIVRLIPRLRNVFTFPAALISTVFWKFIASPMGSIVPKGIDAFVHGKGETEIKFKNSKAVKQTSDVDYQVKIDNLLAAKGVRQDFINLQGWDADFASHSIAVCKLAERANEDPIIVASFLLESLNYYHNNRDVSLSYLARLESAYTAKIENPNWAKEIEYEIGKKDEFDELFNSIDLECDSPEANYIRQVNKFIYSVGHFENLVKPALQNNTFSKALSNVYLTGFWCNSSPKVVGALIADGANKFKTNPELGILFLDNVAKNMRKQHDSSLCDSGGSIKKGFESVTTIAGKDADDPNSYHDNLVKISESSYSFLKSFIQVEEEVAIKLNSELLLYLATYKAWLDSKVHIYPGTWNTFKRSIEVRMLSLKEDEHKQGSIIEDSQGNKGFAHFVSSYWLRMDRLEAILRANNMTDFAEALLDDFGVNSDNKELFIQFFEVTSKAAADTVLKDVIALES